MKKLFSLPLLTLLIAFSSVAPVVSAEDVFNKVCTGTGGNASSTLCEEANKNSTKTDNGLFGTNGILNKVANVLVVVVGVAGVIMVIVGGIQYTLSAGDPARVTKAKDLIIYALVGMVIAVLAKGIIVFVINKL